MDKYSFFTGTKHEYLYGWLSIQKDIQCRILIYISFHKYLLYVRNDFQWKASYKLECVFAMNCLNADNKINFLKLKHFGKNVMHFQVDLFEES